MLSLLIFSCSLFDAFAIITPPDAAMLIFTRHFAFLRRFLIAIFDFDYIY